jgi:hypothetical protein
MGIQQPPIISQWYRHLDKGQSFQVTAVDEEAGTIEVQHFDGDLEEIEVEDWPDMALETIETPEDWTGPMDDIERDDLGYTETEMQPGDWAEPLNETSTSQESEERTEEED